MIGSLLLGLRLAVSGSRIRAALIVLGNAVGVVLLLAVAAVPAAVTGPGQGISLEHRRLVTTIVLFLAMPVVLLLMAVGRLSGTSRDRRLAALRLLGLSPALTRVVAGAENAALAALGAGLGASVFRLLAPVADRLVEGRPGFVDALRPSLTATALVVLAVPLGSALVSIAPSRALAGNAPGVRRDADAHKPSVWRLVPVSVGIALLVWSATRSVDPDFAVPWQFVAAFFAGSVLAGIGLPLAIPLGVRWVADLLIRRWPGVAGNLAGRRLQVEPAATTRSVAGILLALFITTGAAGVLVAFEQTEQYQRAARANSVGPQYADIHPPWSPGVAGLSPPPDTSLLHQVPGVRGLAPMRSLESGCTLGSQPCYQAYVGSCADLVALTGVTGCRDDRASWLIDATGSAGLPATGAVPARLRFGSVMGEDTPTVEVTAPTTTLRIARDEDDPLWNAIWSNVFVPETLPGVAAAVGEPRWWRIILDGGPGPRAALRAALDVAAPGYEVIYEFELENYYVQVSGYRSILWTVAGAAVCVGLFALLVTAIDRAIERRRQIVALHVVGAPAGVVRRTQVVQSALPLVAGAPLAAGLGLLAGAAYLNYGGIVEHTPWRIGLITAAAGLGSAVILAVGTLPALRGANPELLRRE